MNYRAWRVRSGSFSIPDYEIYGTNLTDAVNRSYELIGKNLAPWIPVENILVLDMKWQSDVFSGHGGVELTLRVLNNGSLEELVTWIAATREEAPPHMVWKKTGNTMQILKFERAIA